VELQVPAAPFPRPSELEIGVAEPNLNAT
jgi:hypothetical protein